MIDKKRCARVRYYISVSLSEYNPVMNARIYTLTILFSNIVNVVNPYPETLFYAYIVPRVFPTKMELDSKI
jgi:hypothetical protein